MRKGSEILVSLVSAMLLAACGGSSTAPTVSTGVFLDSPVEGIGYRTSSQSGFTNNKGEFSFVSGETVTFFVGSLELPPVQAKSTVTPLDIAQTNDVNDHLVTNILVLLQSLDEDGDPNTGIKIPNTAASVAPHEVSFDISASEFITDERINSFFAQSGSINTVAVSTTTATEHFQKTLADINNTFNTLVSVIKETSGINCPTGGNKILMGLDLNRDGTLDTNEATSTQYGCNGSIPDITPPNIQFISSENITQQNGWLYVDISDETELAYTVNSDTMSFLPNPFIFEKETKYVADHPVTGYSIPLGRSERITVLASDTSGNIAKKEITLTPPQPAIKMGYYQPTTSYSIPTGFNCVANSSLPEWMTSNVRINDADVISEMVRLSSRDTWSIAEGYMPRITISLGIHSHEFNSSNIISLDDVNFILNNSASSSSGQDGSLKTKWSGEVSIDQSQPDTLNITLILNCNSNNAGYISGEPAIFKVKYITMPIATARVSDSSPLVGTSVKAYPSIVTNSWNKHTYLWNLTSVPNGSSASLSSTTTENPTLTADIAGDYVISLVVNDGVADSEPATITVTTQ